MRIFTLDIVLQLKISMDEIESEFFFLNVVVLELQSDNKKKTFLSKIVDRYQNVDKKDTLSKDKINTMHKLYKIKAEEAFENAIFFLAITSFSDEQRVSKYVL